MQRRRLSTGERKEIILTAAATLIRDKGNHALSHEEVAHHCETPTSVATVRRYFGSWRDLAKAVSRHPSCPTGFKEYLGRIE